MTFIIHNTGFFYFIANCKETVLRLIIVLIKYLKLDRVFKKKRLINFYNQILNTIKAINVPHQVSLESKHLLILKLIFEQEFYFLLIKHI